MDSTCLKASGIGGNSIIARNGLSASTWKGVAPCHVTRQGRSVMLYIQYALGSALKIVATELITLELYGIANNRCMYGTRTFEVVQKRTGELTIDKYSYLEFQVQA